MFLDDGTPKMELQGKLQTQSSNEFEHQGPVHLPGGDPGSALSGANGKKPGGSRTGRTTNVNNTTRMCGG
jgi:hypothetical protein